jgi:hypothetical protein
VSFSLEVNIIATTAQQVFDAAMDLVDERLDSGSISESDTVSYRVKAPGILTILQAELLKPGDIFSTYEISNKPVENLLGDSFDVQAFEGDELTYECEGSAKAYYFEADRAGTVYVEDYNGAWNTLATVTTSAGTGFTAYSGVVTASSGATRSRLRFGGTYYYRHVNRALFGVPFATAGDVPVYRAWVKKQMPTDFKSVDEIIEETAEEYNKAGGYKWEGKRDLYIPYSFNGNIRIIYRPVPSVISALTDTMQLDDVTCRTVVPYGLAAQLMLQDNAGIASFFQERYEELRSKEERTQPAAFEAIQNVYGGFG